MKFRMKAFLTSGSMLLLTVLTCQSQESVSSYYNNRQMRFLEQMDAGIAVFTNVSESGRAGARFAKYFSYLSSFEGMPAYLILIKTPEPKRILLTRPSQRTPAIWSVAPPGMDEAIASGEVDAVYPVNSLDSLLTVLLKSHKHVYMLNGQNDLRTKVTDLAGKAGVKAEIHAAQPILDEMRVIKDALEISYLRKAINITAEAQQAALEFARPGHYEYQVQAVIEYTYTFNGADGPGFTSIVGSGANACILHYDSNNKVIGENELLLMDIGAAYKGYTADITRTYPPSGKMTPEQLEIYSPVLKAQNAAIATMMPGHGLEAAHNSHYIGLDVHDVGDYGRQKREGRPLLPGMVLTIEPGIYLHPDLLDHLPDLTRGRASEAEIEAFRTRVAPIYQKYKGIGVRIEDDVLITETGQEVLSAAAPKELQDILR